MNEQNEEKSQNITNALSRDEIYDFIQINKNKYSSEYTLTTKLTDNLPITYFKVIYEKHPTVMTQIYEDKNKKI